MVRKLPLSRWWLVAASAVVMGATGTYQFVWSSVRTELGAQLGASEAALGTVFTIFVLAQTISQFPAGRLRDRRGPTLPLVGGGVLIALGYLGTAYATVVGHVYVFYAIGGVGAGAMYTVAVNTPVKWFRERRGLATGIVTMSYGGASVAVIPFVRRGMAADAATTLVALGVVSGVAALVGLVVIRDPRDDDGVAPDGGDNPSAAVAEEPAGGDPASAAPGAPEQDGEGESDGDRDGDDYSWRDAVRTWQFWHLYAVFVVVHGVGLMLIGKSISFSQGLGLSAAIATATASALALSDSIGILVISGLADRLGHERTAAASLALAGVALAAAVFAGNAGLGGAFVVLAGAAAFFRSPAFAIFPSLVGEYYGETYSSENYALLYSAKVWGGVVGGVASSLLIAWLGWTPSFLVGGSLLAVAGASVFFLRPV